MDSSLAFMMDALSTILTVNGLLYVFGGCIIGLFFGMMPGLAGGMVMTMMLPISFKLDPVLVLAFFTSVHVGSTSGSMVGSILLGIPATSSSIATSWDGYEFTKRGDPVRPLSVATMCNVLGTIPSVLIALFFCTMIARWAVKLGPWEYAAMCFFAICMILGMSKGNLVRGFVAVGLAIIVSSIGIDPIAGSLRLTFGQINLFGGIHVVNLILGLFAARIILLEYARGSKVDATKNVKVRSFKWPGEDLKNNRGNLIRSFTTGAFCGFLPGIGAPTASIMAYANEKTFSKEKEKWGVGKEGHIGGIIAPEITNSACLGGSMIPTLALGIPGDVIMVMFITVMQIHGINPGPLLIRTNPDVVYMVFTAALVAGIAILIIQIFSMPLYPRFLTVPYHYLYPAIVVFCLLGSYMVSMSMFGMFITIAACLLGLVMDYFKVDSMPFIMMVILSGIIEKNIRQAMNFSFVGVAEFFTRPLSAFFIIAGILFLCYNLFGDEVKNYIKKRKNVAQS